MPFCFQITRNFHMDAVALGPCVLYVAGHGPQLPGPLVLPHMTTL